MSAISCRHIFSNSNIFRHFNLTEFYLTPGFTQIEMNDSEMEGEANGSFVQSLISCKIFLVSPRHILGISQAKNNPYIFQKYPLETGKRQHKLAAAIIAGIESYTICFKCNMLVFLLSCLNCERRFRV